MLQKKIGACQWQKTFNFYLLCKEILHKRMDNNDYQLIQHGTTKEKKYANQLTFLYRAATSRFT